MIVEFVYIWTAFELWPLRLHCGCWCLRIRHFISLHPESIGWRPNPRPEHLHHHRRHRPSHSSLLSLLLCQVILLQAFNNVIFTFSLGTFHLTLWASSKSMCLINVQVLWLKKRGRRWNWLGQKWRGDIWIYIIKGYEIKSILSHHKLERECYF